MYLFRALKGGVSLQELSEMQGLMAFTYWSSPPQKWQVDVAIIIYYFAQTAILLQVWG